MAEWPLDDFSLDIIIPIHHGGNHYVTAILHREAKTMYLVDSYRNDMTTIGNKLIQWHNLMMDVYKVQHINWTIVQGDNLPGNLPRQQDGVSCGVFASMTAYY